MATSFLSPTNRIYRVVAMTDGATVTPNASTTDIGTVTFAGNRTMANPSGTKHDGQHLELRVKQDGTGGRTITWGSEYSFPSGVSGVLNPVASATSVFRFVYNSAATKWENWSLSAGGIVGRNQRTTDNTTYSSTFVRIIETRADVIAGRTYWIWSYGEFYGTASNQVLLQNELRYTTDGTEPTTSSTQLSRAIAFNSSTAGAATGIVTAGFYPATATGQFRITLCSASVAGTGDVKWTAASGRATDIVITDLGTSKSLVGTVY